MENYQLGKVLGDGTFGTVYRATDLTNGEVVAIKKMKQKYIKWDDVISQQEVKTLSKLHHPNIVSLKEVIKQNNEVFFVFEYMDRSKPLQEFQIRNIIYQTMQGLHFMHKSGMFHRDLKPENLLETNGIVKIADFGLVRDIRSKPPFTDYVSTRWYRAPEVILRSTEYSSPIDIFAIGCIMAELYRGWPLFPGQSERDQLNKLISVLGVPKDTDWPDGYKLASKLQIKFNAPTSQIGLSKQITNANDFGMDLLSQMLQYNPLKRPNAFQVLSHRYFQCSLEVETLLYDKNEISIANQHQQEFVVEQEINSYEDKDTDDLINEIMKEVENKDFFDTMMETMMERVQKTKYKVGYVCEI